MSIDPERPSLWEEILWERVQQDVEHGGPENDDTLSHADWIGVLTQFAGRAFSCARLGRGDLYRARLVQVAAVACAAVESFDRVNPSSPLPLGHLRAGPDVPPENGHAETTPDLAPVPPIPAAPDCPT